MNILFLTIAYPDEHNRNIYSDLMHEFCRRDHNVYVLCSSERRLGKSTQYAQEKGIMVVRQKTLNLTQTNLLEKGLGTVLIETQFIQTIKKFFSGIKFDLVMYSTPPITFDKAVRFLKDRDSCMSYLLLKDIFPQNAVDLSMMKRNSLIWRYFRRKEKRLYAISDYIGCMSKANVEYVLQHNPEFSAKKVEECPNSINPRVFQHNSVAIGQMRTKYALPADAVICMYGGNLGKPQGIGFLIEILKAVSQRKDVFFLIVGSGTEYTLIEEYLIKTRQVNARLMKYLPKDDYDQLIQTCDIGLIFLHPDFTIPNFPSRLTAYMEAALPVLAATDINTDIKDVLLNGECGLWAKSGDLDSFLANLNLLVSNSKLRTDMGMASRRYLEEHYTVARSCDIIERHFPKKDEAGFVSRRGPNETHI